MNRVHHVSDELHRLSRKYAALPPEKRGSFRALLSTNGIDRDRLPIVPIADGSAPLPLSFGQERLWFLWKLDPQRADYNVSGAVHLEGDLDVSSVQAALRALVGHHDALRTRFDEEGGIPRQLIATSPNFAWTTHDLRGDLDVDARLAEAFRRGVLTPFDLTLGPLFRVALVRLAEREHVLLLAAHHIVCDGWSVAILLRDFVGLYRAQREGSVPSLTKPPISYADFSVWQREWLDEPALADKLASLRARLGTEHPRLNLSTRRLRDGGSRGGATTVMLGAELSELVRRCSRSRGVTLFHALLAVWSALLSRIAAERDVRVGIPVAGRRRLETQELVGFFVNTLVIRCELEPRVTFGELLAQVQARVIEAERLQDVPFARLVDALAPERGAGGATLFDVSFDLEQDDSERVLGDLPGVSVSALELEPGPPKFELSLHVTELADDFRLVFEYAADVLDGAFVDDLAQHYRDLLSFCVEQPETPLIVAPLVAATEAWGTDESRGGSLLTRVAEWARVRPDATALVHEGNELSWSQLWSWSGRLARQLRKVGVACEQVVALCMPRSAALVASILAVWRAGALYLPLDPSLPRERLAFQLEDAKALVALADDELSWPPQHVTLLRPSAFRGPNEPAADSPLDQAPFDSQAAYVIYTSGTTGRPKGVVVHHGALADYVRSLEDRLPTAIASAAYVSTPAADLGHSVLFGALYYGWTLHTVSDEVGSDPDRFSEYMRTHQVDALKIVPSHLAVLFEARDAAGVLPKRCLILGGEAAEASLLTRAVQLKPDCRIINHYGPTETTVGVLTHRVDQLPTSPLPLGVPLSHSRVYVVDAEGRPSPRGGIGEIAVGGAGVARGYLGRAGLTAERFVPDPLGQPGSRLYRSGDKGRHVANGEVEFLGRFDDQVKIRGYRVEPREVAARLAELPRVRASYVIARPDARGQQRLLGYCVGDELSGAELRASLEATLPSYLVPSVIQVLDALPLTGNGKIDRAALPEPDERRLVAWVPARNEREQILLDVFRRVLGRDDIGVSDDFFALGGESLLSLQVVARARQAGLTFSVKELFANPRVDRLAAIARATASTPRVWSEVEGEIPLTPIQARFFAKNAANLSHWNQSILLRVRGELDHAALDAALSVIIERHDALRLRFEPGEHGVCQRVAHGPSERVLECLDLRGEIDPKHRLEIEGNRLQKSLDISHGPLLKAGYFRLDEGQGRLLLVVHHLAVDGVSFGVLLEELEAAYDSLLHGAVLTTEPAALPWSAWASELERYACRPELIAERGYWTAALAGVDGRLPVSPHGDRSVGASREVVQRWDTTVTRCMLEGASRAFGMRIDEVLVAALAETIAEWTGQRGALIELEGHGRELVIDGFDPTRTVGWFTTRYPVWLPATGSAPTVLENVKEALRSVPKKGLNWGLFAYSKDEAARVECERLPKPDVSFNYLGRLDALLREGGRFSLADEPAGESLAPESQWAHSLDLLGVVSGGELSLRWRFSPTVVSEAEVARLASAFESKLEALFAFLATAEATATASDFRLAAIAQPDLARLHIERADLQDVYPATALQQGLLFHGALATGTGFYVNQRRLTLEREVDRAALHATWQAAVARHDVLRTHFEATEDGRMLQVVHRAVSLPYEDHDWSGERDYEARLACFLEADLVRGFDARRVPLLRVNVFARPDGKIELVWTYHHALLDGWSSAILLAELARDYRARIAGVRPNLPDPIPYRRFVEWYLEQPSAEAWWKTELLSMSEPAGVLDALGSPDRPERGAQRERLVVGEPLSERLRVAARRQRVTLGTLVQAAWALTLARYADRTQVVFGITVAGRPAELAESDRMLGPFINSLPIWVDVPPQARLSQWLTDLQRRSSELRQYEHTPLQRIQHWAGRAGSSLFDSLLVFENYPIDDELKQGSFASAQFESVDRTHYPLVLTVVPDRQLIVEWEWDSEKLGRAGVEQLARHYVELLDQLSGDADPLLRAIRPRTTTRATNASARRAPAVEPSMPLLVIERVARRMLERPNADAIVCGTERMTYGQLRVSAEGIARRLLEAGVNPDERVGLCVGRSPHLFAACLGIWLASGAYVPLDPAHPEERTRAIVAGAKIRCVVADANSAEAARGALAGCAVILAETPQETGESLAHRLHPDQLAYVIYTSGSTGEPKGVAVSQRSLAVHVEDCLQLLELGESDRVCQFSTIHFDASAEQAFPALAAGACLVMRGRELPEWSDLERMLRDEQVSVVDLPTAYFQQGVDQALSGLPALRVLTIGGEALSPAALARWKAGPHGSLRLLNAYGPTEATITCAVHQTTVEDGRRAAVPIGAPLPSRRIYLLDDEGYEAPSFGVGEICVGGDALARGYLGGAGATAASFVPDPYAQGQRLYRTGDRGRRDEHGLITFLGRRDEQIKIRGYRVELGELESALAKCPGVAQAVATVHETGDTRWLAAYVVGPASEDEVRRQLERLLPAHALPASIDVLPGLPLSGNGKVNRKALPAPMLPQSRRRSAPETELERRLLSIWQTILSRPELSVTDHFFEVGGDSISTLQVVARARAEGIHVTPKQVFEHPTIARLAQVAQVAVVIVAEPARYDELPLTPIQSWFFERYPEGEAHYNQSVLLGIQGEVDVVALESAVRAVLERHDALQMRFVRRGPGWKQQLIRGGTRRALEPTVDLRHHEDWPERLEAEADRLQRSLDLTHGPLFRAAYFRTADDDGRLLLLAHHLTVDAVSWRVLVRDLAVAYQRAIRGEATTLPPVRVPWTAWVAAAHRHAAGEGVRKELGFWQQALAAASRTLPGIREQSAPEAGSDSDELTLRLGADLTSRLVVAAPRAYHLDVGEVVLTALTQAITQGTGGVLVDVEGHGRDDLGLDRDLSETVGWFTTEFPVWLEVPVNDAEALRSVKERLRSMPRKGAHVGWLRYVLEGPSGAPLGALPQAQVSFNYLGRFDGALASEGLFSLAREATGTQAAPGTQLTHALQVSALIEGGELSVRLRFAQANVAPEVARAWLSRFETRLLALVEHCELAEPVGTASDFPLAQLTRQELEAINTSNVVDIYPATPSQQGLLFHTMHDGGWGLYVDQIRFTMAASVDVLRLRRAWEQAIQRHDILRTRFEWQHGGKPLQVVQREATLPFVETDASSIVDYESYLAALLMDDLAQGFDLDRAPLMRVCIVRRPDGALDVIWTSHHALLDGWSTSRLLGEILESYRQPQVTPKRTPIPYRGYVAWLGEQPSTEAWWRAKLASTRDPARLLPSLSRKTSSGVGSRKLVLPLDSVLDARIRQRAQMWRLTLSTLTQAAWALVLGCYGNRDQAVFGVTVSGRPPELTGIEEMLGLFMHSLPIWVDLPAETRVAVWLDGLQRDNVALRQHEHTPLSEIQRWSGLAGDALFDTLFVFENYPVHGALSDGANELGVSRLEKVDRTHFPLTVTVRPEPVLQFEWEWDEARIEGATASALARDFVRALEQLTLATRETRVGEISLGDAAAARIPVTHPYRPVPSQIAGQCLAWVDRAAVQCDASVASYGELGAWSSWLGVELTSRGVRREQLVGLCVSRSLSLVASVLGIWKSGGAVVPLDPTYPEERLRQMLKGVTVVVADAVTSSSLNTILSGVQLVEVGFAPGWRAGAASDSVERQAATTTLRTEHRPDELAYVIYTSGSTGEPKGVAVSHGSLSAHIQDFVDHYRIDETDCQLFSSTINFDVWLHELLPALTRGGRVMMRGEAPWEFATLTEHLRGREVTFARVSTAYWAQWVKWLRHEGQGVALPSQLRQVTVGGEGLSGDALKDWFSGPLASVRLDNLYGPTETTVAALHHRTSEADAREVVVPIGHPFPSRGVAVIDAWGREVPAGGVGELCIRGATVARGYLGRASETAARFVPDPRVTGGRLYRTGDLSRLCADGTAEFLGRTDEQIKLRGYRIELGEVETALRSCAGVREAVAAVRGEGEHRRLIGYVTGQPDLDALREELSRKLPAYMVPAAYARLESLPVLANGKVDRRGLPEPGLVAREQPLPARTPTEAALQEVWQRVLKRAEIGVRDNYFELGGDSILTLQIVAAARQRGLKLTPKQLFEQPTIEALSRVAVELSPVHIEQAAVLGNIPLTPIQSRFFELHPDGPSHWNQSILLRVREELSVEALQRALDLLVLRHDALRLRFQKRDGQWTQSLQEHVAPSPVEVFVIADGDDVRQALEREGERVQRSLDLVAGPLFRAGYFRLSGGEGRLLLVAHHLVVDGVSWRVLLDEISQEYERAERHLPSELPVGSSPFSLWATKLADYATRPEVRAQSSWWRDSLSSSEPILPSRSKQERSLRASQQVTWELDPVETRRLLEAAPRAYRMRIDEVLLTALVQTVAERGESSGVLVDLEGHGREDVLADLDVSRTVGWFTSRFPVWLAAHSDAERALVSVKESLRRVPDKGFHWGLLRYAADHALRTEMSAFAHPR